MKVIQYKVRNISWKRSSASGLMFQVGQVTIRRETVSVFRGNGQNGWLTAYPGQF
jgi:hypothetical protein